MAFIRIPRGWEMPAHEATPAHVFENRRTFLKEMGFAGLGLLAGCGAQPEAETAPERPTPPDIAALYPARRNPAFTLDRKLTDERVAASYNNFYEFTTDKEEVRNLVDNFRIRPWQLEVRGLVEKPRIYDVDDLVRRLPLEERLYRFRCVEAWAMAVPWTGFTFKALIDEVKPLSAARYVRLVSFYKPDQARGQKLQKWYSWPYYEALTMAEASNELTLLVTGIYGHELPKQHGAPIRLIAPWKYGFKSIKSIVQIEFLEEQPSTFWSDASAEYDFWANVDPEVPHPRWSQASERLIDTGERVPTQLYNGYAAYVADLYKKT